MAELKIRPSCSGFCCPMDTKSLSCSIDVSVEGEVGRKARELKWAITKTEVDLEFSAESSTGGAGWSQFWHIDTHIDRASAKKPDAPHPMFHLHFGGNRMADYDANKRRDA